MHLILHHHHPRSSIPSGGESSGPPWENLSRKKNISFLFCTFPLEKNNWNPFFGSCSTLQPPKYPLTPFSINASTTQFFLRKERKKLYEIIIVDRSVLRWDVRTYILTYVRITRYLFRCEVVK